MKPHSWLTNLGLIVPAFIIAFVIWLIAKQGDTRTDLITANVELTRIPENVEARVRTRRLEVSMIYPKTFMDKVREPGGLTVELDCSDLNEQLGSEEGFKEITREIYPEMIKTHRLPRSVRILRTVPERVVIEARLHVREVKVLPRYRGAPRENFEVRAVTASPPTVRLSASPARLDALIDASGPGGVETESLDITDAASDISNLVRLRLPETMRRLDADGSPFVEVTAEIREKETTAVIRNVPITYPFITAWRVTIQPGAMDVQVTGPTSLIEALNAESFRFETETTPIEEPGRAQYLLFLPRLRDERLAAQVRVEALLKDPVKVTFEDTRALPTPTPAATPR